MRKYIIIKGSEVFFDRTLREIEEDYFSDENSDFLENVKQSDSMMKTGNYKKISREFLFIKNHHYHGINAEAHHRIGKLIEDYTSDNSTIVVHNPTRTLMDYINNKLDDEQVEADIIVENHIMIRDASIFQKNISRINDKVFGQEYAVKEITKTLWYLTKIERELPYVIMLYGDSGVGKTEMVREVSKYFFENKMLEKHLSMFQNEAYSDYFFGEKPTSKTLSYELFSRESNLIFLDELDKCPKHFHSAFYTLFDNTEFSDSSYNVDISKTIIFLTSNYRSQTEMLNELGAPIYYRIDKFISFKEFELNTIKQILEREVNQREKEYKDIFTKEQLLEVAKTQIKQTGENGRTIKQKVQKVIEEILFEELQDSN